MKLSLKHARALLHMASRGWDYDATDRQALAALEIALKPRPVSSARRKTAQKREAKKAETARIRAALVVRANGLCEHCTFAFTLSNPAEMDHFFGRGREPQTVRNCWLLCRLCHGNKTALRPNSEYWLTSFFNHAHRLEFWTEAAKARARLDALRMIPKEAARAE